MTKAYDTNWCDSMAHSRPATDDERAEDMRRRIEALEAAERDGRMGARQVDDHWRALDGFQGYRRCTLAESRAGIAKLAERGWTAGPPLCPEHAAGEIRR